MVRIVLTSGDPPGAWRSASASNSGRRSGARSATAARWRATVVLVAARDRAGERRLGARGGPVLDGGAHERGEQRAVDAGGGREPLGRALERDRKFDAIEAAAW